MRRTVATEALLAHLPLFSGLSADELAPITAGTVRRKLKRGEVLFRQGDRPAAIHLLVYGRIKLAATSESGKERVIDVVGPGGSFGDAITFLERPYIVTATALCDSLVLEIAKEAVFATLERSPRFVRRVIGTLAARIEALIREREMQEGTGARRLVGWLARRPEASAGTGSATVVLAEPKRLLAARLDLSAEHLSRILHDLAGERLIAVRGRRVTIPDVGRLRAWRPRAEARPQP